MIARVVAPARERGLKLTKRLDKANQLCRRSRKGAWIEMSLIGGALSNSAVAPARERGLKCQAFMLQRYYEIVAPARERGLKSLNL